MDQHIVSDQGPGNTNQINPKTNPTMAQSRKTPAKKASSKATPAKTEKPHSKGKKKETREKIMAAARHVFSNYPYHSASIRMIGKMAEIEHPLISYYFPNKADLFVSVLKEVTKKQNIAEAGFLDDVKSMTSSRGLALFFDHLLDHYRKYPEVYSIIALNMVQSEDSEPIPGYQIIQDTLNATVVNFIEKIPLSAPVYEVEMFCRALANHMISFLGASHYHASIMNMDPSSIQYLNWVKDSGLYAFLPRLKMMVKRVDSDSNS